MREGRFGAGGMKKGQTMNRRIMPPIEVFNRHTDKAGECWIWKSVITVWGYGRIAFCPKKYKQIRMAAHRWSYQHFKGKIPNGYQIDHLCKNKRCVNPDHLEAVTPRENNRRSNSPSALNSRKTECIKGHPFNDSNTRIDYKGRRVCRPCMRAHDIRYREIKKVARNG